MNNSSTLEILGSSHLVLLCLWAGIVMAEGVIELYPFKDKTFRRSAVIYHYYIDLFLELPLILGVLVTGGLLTMMVPLTISHYIKVAAGLVAITMNFICIGVVIKRKKLLESGAQEERVMRGTRHVFMTVTIGLPAALIALYMVFKISS